MTRLLHICFRALVACVSAGAIYAATVAGSVAVTAPAHVRISPEKLSDIVVWLQPLHAALGGPQPGRAELLQKDKAFHPHVLAVRTGTVIDFPNADPIFHNAFSNYDGQLFDVGLYPPGSSRSIRFRHPGVVRVFCNIHPSMSAVILVLDTPLFTHAQSSGAFRLADVPEGEYELHAFDERAAEPGLEIPVIVKDAGSNIEVPPIRFSEAGYVQPPHKNKYGRDYEPQSAADRPYDGAVQ
jgi:hypothetical protein